MPSPYGRQRPTTTVASPSIPPRNSRSSRDLPIPAGPATVTSTHLRRSTARRKRARSDRSSARRPTSGTPAPAAKRPPAGASPVTCHTRSGRRLPASAAGPWARRRAALPTSLRVWGPIRMPLAGAADCRRAAVLTASPATSPCPPPASPVATSPVLTPIRRSMPTPRSRTRSTFSSAIASRISQAARTARRASSSCSTGTPNTAMTASPMYFSTVPPCRSRGPRMAAK